MNADERRQRSQAATDLPDGDITGRVIGLFFEVDDEVGFGFSEPVYREAMALAMDEAGVRFVREPTLVVRMRGRTIGTFRPDFVVEDRVIVECKVARELLDRHDVQLLNYLRVSDLETGLLLNFGPKPRFRRRVFSNSRKIVRVRPR